MTLSVRSIAAILVGFVLAGCTQITEPLRLRSENALHRLPARNAAADGLLRLSTSVEVSDRTIVTGSDVPIVLSVTNNEHVAISVVNGPCRLWFVVYDRHGTQVSGTCPGGYYIPDPVTVQPGQSLQIRTYWKAASYYYDNGVIYVPLPPGPYRIHAYFVPDWPHPWDTYLSAPIVVHLVEQGTSH